MRTLASIQLIKEIKDIPNSDNLQVATVLGWHCVIQKDTHKKNDLICFFEIDSFLPIRPEFEFLRARCYKKMDHGDGFRLRTIRLRKQVSQGLIMPLSIIPDGLAYTEVEGYDLTEALGVIKYERPIPATMKGTVKGGFPSFMLKSDETRIQVLQNALTRYAGTKCYYTEKLDGTSFTAYIRDEEFGVCNRNLELKDTEENLYWTMARELKIEEKLRALNKNVMVQGEIVGTGVQKNPLKIPGRKVCFFNAFDIDAYKYFNYTEFIDLMGELDLETVPMLSNDFKLIDDIDELVELSKGASVINPDVKREGIVIRPLKEGVDLELARGFSNGRVSFKAINPEYLLESDA